MDLKINQITQSTPVETVQQTTPTDGTFKFTLASHIEEADLQARLSSMMEEITRQGDRLYKKRDVRDMKRYRGLIKE